MSIETVAMVVVTCDRCGEKSGVIPQIQGEAWTNIHEQRHAIKDRIERMWLLGHDCHAVTDWMSEDDSEGHAECSCGWRSRHAKACWASDFRDQHLAGIEQKLLNAWAETELSQAA